MLIATLIWIILSKSSSKTVVNPTKRVAEDSGVATNVESANEKPSSRKRSAREIAQLYEQLKRIRDHYDI